ncbi:MAG: metallophosphoesterase [Methanomicrobiales archaeon]
MGKNDKPKALKYRRKMQYSMDKARSKLGRHKFKAEDFEIVTIKVTIPDLNPEFHGYRIINIADIHLGQWLTPTRLNGVIELINNQNPDMVTITGDFVSYEIDGVLNDLSNCLAKLEPKDVALAVLGNHDHWLGTDKIRSVLKKNDIIDVSNYVYTQKKKDSVLHIAGVDSVMLEKHCLDKVMEIIPDYGPAILLAHEPDFADISSTTGRFSLQISGHSHGGQFIIPGIGTFIRGPHFVKYPVGEYKVGDMVQYTSRGLGTNVFWFRINCPPEITVFILESPELSYDEN